jgi:hypothetical protein
LSTANRSFIQAETVTLPAGAKMQCHAVAAAPIALAINYLINYHKPLMPLRNMGWCL